MVFGSFPPPHQNLKKIKNKENVVKVVQNLLDPRMIMVLNINSVGSGVLCSHTHDALTDLILSKSCR